MIRIAVYTAFTRRYDFLFPPSARLDGARCVAFVDDESTLVRGWCLRPFPSAVAGYSPRLANRYCKFFPHKILHHTDYSVYIDGNIRIIGNITPLVVEFIKSNAAIGFFKHRQRSSLIQEFNACIQLGKFAKGEKEKAAAQLDLYRQEGMPLDQSLLDNGIIFRCHHHPMLPEAMASEWEQLRHFSRRDQLSLPYVLWKTGIPTKIWNWSFREKNPIFEVYPHRGFIFRDLLIFLAAYRKANRYVGAVYRLCEKIKTV